MASVAHVDRVLKAYEAIKQAPADGQQDTLSNQKDRLQACALLREAVCDAASR